ncbi:MAG TPA: hypothetical protein VMZ06_11350 [Candidatus Bathyarchaeia archaeon]|nr:hypothetical protein [Candidatus Bathyarchaeia archaeon]
MFHFGQRSFYIATLLTALVLAGGSDATENMVYWTQPEGPSGGGGVYRSSIEGGLPVLTSPNMVSGFGFDWEAGKMYWSENVLGVINRANLDGTEAEVFATGSDVGSIVLDRGHGWVYFYDGTAIKRAPMSGAPIETVLPASTLGWLTPVAPFAVDGAGGMIYWPDGASIKRTDLEGVHTLASAQNYPLGVALDIGAGKMYWCCMYAGTVCRANLDGTGQEVLLTGENVPNEVRVDATNQKIHWTTASGIRRANLDGTGAETLVAGVHKNLALDGAGNRMYWTNAGEGRLYGAELDGTNPYIVLAGRNQPWAVAVDATAGKLYWTELGAMSVYRSDLNGSNVELVYGACTDAPVAIAVDHAGGKIYWMQYDGEIWSASLSGASPAMVYDLQTIPGGLDVDPSGGRLYWAEAANGKIVRARAAGFQTVYTGSYEVIGVSLDALHGKIWWSEVEGNQIRRANLDGTSVETVLTAPQPMIILPDSARGKVYWISNTTPPLGDNATYDVREANLDGTGQRILREPGNLIGIGLAVSDDGGTLFWWDFFGVYRLPLAATIPITGLQDVPVDVELDLNGGKMYWSEFNAGIIHRANLDGTGAEDLLTGLSDPAGIALDLVHDKVYWVQPDSLCRANLNGSGIETVRTFSGNVADVELDLVRSRIFWVDVAAEALFSCDLSGGDLQQMLTNEVDSMALAIDLAAGKVYFAYGDGIYRCDTDGQNKEEVQPSTWGPNSFALDVAGGKIYWTQSGAVKRANMADGSDMETLYDGLPSSFGIALDVPVLPVIQPLDDASLFNNDAYSVTPTLIEGTQPVTWSLALPLTLPTDMAVNPVTGRVTWTAAPQFSPLDIWLSACNSAGCGTEEWTVTVAQGNTIACSVSPYDIVEGMRIELIAPEGTNYQWRKNGVDLENDGHFTGVTERVLVLDHVSLEDAGIYTCLYNNGAGKEIVETEPFELVVQPPMPAAGFPGLAIVAAALLLAATYSFGGNSQAREEK